MEGKEPFRITKNISHSRLWCCKCIPLVVEESRGALEGLGAEVAAVRSLIVVAPLVVSEPG